MGSDSSTQSQNNQIQRNQHNLFSFLFSLLENVRQTKRKKNMPCSVTRLGFHNIWTDACRNHASANDPTTHCCYLKIK